MHEPGFICPQSTKTLWQYVTAQELRIKSMFHPVHGDNDMQILCQVPEKLRVSGPSRDTVRQRSAANSIVSSTPDSTEGEQSDGNCENPRSQWAVKAAIMPLAVHAVHPSQIWQLILIKLLLIRCALPDHMIDSSSFMGHASVHCHSIIYTTRKLVYRQGLKREKRG